MTRRVEVTPHGEVTRRVEVTRVTKAYGARTVVRDVSFRIEGGEVYGLLGPNGAGKTTTLSIVATLVAPDTGDARVGGLSVVAARNTSATYNAVTNPVDDTEADVIRGANRMASPVVNAYYIPQFDATVGAVGEPLTTVSETITVASSR